MKQTKQFLRPLLMAIVMLVGMLMPQGAWAQELEVWEEEPISISSDASYDEIVVQPGGVLIINEGVTLTVTSSLYINENNINGFGTVINYGTIIGEGCINMMGGVLANHGHIDLSDGFGYGTFYNTGTLGDGDFNLTPTECNHAYYDELGPVAATCTHGAGTQFKCNTCYYIGIKETGEPSPHDNYDHNGLTVCSTCGQLTFDATPVGEGTAESPYQIANAGHLFWFADKVNNDYDNFKDANAVLTADIVVNDGTFADDGTFTATGASGTSTPIEWLIIGRFDLSSYGYRGTFDGQGHTISGLYANYTNSGLVGMSSEESKIKNVGVINSYFAGSMVGGICGRAFYNTEISNCYSSNVICKGGYVGGIVGLQALSDISIINCYSTASLIGVEDWAQVGGIAGGISGSTTNCYTTYGNATDWSESEINCEANVSLERFASGEIAYKLNGSVDGEGNWTAGATDGTQKWYQKLGEDGDSYPVLAAAVGNTVYEQKTIDCGGTVVACNYYNTEEEDVTQPHNYQVQQDENSNPVFVWSEDYTTATLQVVCSHHAEHTANVEVTGEDITWEDTTPATCTAAGVRTFTAKATYEGVEYTGTKEVEIEARGHSFEPIHCEWPEDLENGKATITLECSCGEILSLEAEVTSEVTTPATCATEGECTYTVTVTNNGCNFTYTKPGVIPTIDHNWADEAHTHCTECGLTNYDAPELVDNVYQIATASNLYWFANKVNNDHDSFKGANARLTADIVVNSNSYDILWDGIDATYYGTFDGNGHTISGLLISKMGEPTEVGTWGGLFCDLGESAVIKNLGLVNIVYMQGKNTSSEDFYMAGLCRKNSGSISNCYVTGGYIYMTAELGKSLCAGICIDNYGTITNCYTNLLLNLAEKDGKCAGICIENFGNVSNCYTAYATAIGSEDSEATASEVYGDISADRFASGEIAYKLNGSIDGEGNWTAGATDGTQAWYQKLGENGDSYPVLAAAEGNTVYYGYENCLSESETYSNDLRYAEKIDCHVWADEDHTYCNECGHSFIRYTTTGEEIYSNLEENEGLVANVFDSETSSGYLEFDYQLNVISEDAFYNQPLSTVILSWGTNTIDRKAFQDCASLTSITGAWINSIQASAFVGCTSLASVSMPNLSEIKENAFQSCEGLESVDFPSVSTIDDYAFYECTGLSTVSLPKAERIDPSAFHGCTNLTKLSVKCRVNREKGFEDVPEDKISRLHEGDEITIPEKPATCIEAGYEAYSYCAWCEDLVNPVEIPALGHSFTSKTLTATADEHGLYAYACDREGCEGHSDYNVVKAGEAGEGESATTIELIATTDGETTTYTAADVTIEDGKAFSTPVAFTVPSDQVTVERTFTASKPATVMLPFSIDASLVQGATFSEFGGVSYDAEKAQWIATMTSVSTTLQAYKPYIVMLDEGNVTGEVTFDNTSADVATFAVTPAASTMQTADENGWTFQAVNTAKTWGKDDPEIGKAYGFAGQNATYDDYSVAKGEFIKIGVGATAAPGRCYLVKEGALAANAKGMRHAAEVLPSSIKVRFINGEATGIATLNTETGEFTLEGWYDLNGRKINAPAKGGIYVKDGKKVLVK